MRKSFDGLKGVLHEFSIANLNAQFLYVFIDSNEIELLKEEVQRLKTQNAWL